MKKLPLIALLLAAGNVSAQDLQGFYVGGGFAAVDGDTFDDAGNSVDFKTFEILGGYKYDDGIGGVEVRAGVGTGSETYEANVSGTDGGDPTTTNIELSIDNYASIYYRPELSNETAKFYGLLGYTSISISRDYEALDNDDSWDENGLSYGLGVGFTMNPKMNLNFEYRMLISKDDTDFETLSMNIDYRF